MKDKTLDKLRELNGKLEQLQVDLSIYSEEELNNHPQPGVWSALDNITHLMISEALSLAYLKKKLSGGTEVLNKAGVKAKMRSIALNTFMRSNRKRKAPAAVGETAFPEHSKLGDLMDKWRSQRNELKAFLADQPEEVFTLEAYRHPFAGRLSLLGMLQFFGSHFDRHRRQIRRTLGEES